MLVFYNLNFKEFIKLINIYNSILYFNYSFNLFKFYIVLFIIEDYKVINIEKDNHLTIYKDIKFFKYYIKF